MAAEKNIPEIRFKGFEGEWEVSLAKEICSIATGKSNTQDNIEDGLYPFYIRSDKPLRSNRYLYDCEAVLTIGDGNIGKVFHYINGKFDMHQRVYKMTDFKKTTGLYFYYFFSTKFYERAMRMTAKATVDSVRLEMISEMPIKFPSSLPEQTQIGTYFQNLDSLISLHQRKYDKLLTVKKAMLEKMFPKEGADVPEIRFKGFEGKWEKKRLGEIGAVVMNRRIFKDQTTDNGEIPFYKIGTFGGKPDAYISRNLFEEYKSKYPYPKYGDILISASGSIGRTVEYLGSDEYFQDSNIVWLDHDETITNTFLKYFYTVVKWEGLEGSTIKRLYNKNILETKIDLPTVEEQTKIGTFFQNLDTLITQHQKQLEKLKNVKKGCLEKMFV